MESAESAGRNQPGPGGTGRIGYVRVQTSSIEAPGAVLFDRPVRWPPPPDQAARLADWMAPQLLEAWEIVARDLDTPEAISPYLSPGDRGPDGYADAWVSWQDGTGSGIGVPEDEPLAERVVHLADQFQEAEVEALWSAGRSAVWPHCPRHPGSHPLNPRLHGGAAVWSCGESDVIAPIGSLFPR
jgi:hypothetical protein